MQPNEARSNLQRGKERKVQCAGLGTTSGRSGRKVRSKSTFVQLDFVLVLSSTAIQRHVPWVETNWAFFLRNVSRLLTVERFGAFPFARSSVFSLLVMVSIVVPVCYF